MKICIFTHTFPRYKGDTAAPFMGTLAEALSDFGYKVTVLAPFDKKFRKTQHSYKVKLYKYIYPDKLHTLGYSRTLRGDKKMDFASYLLSPFLYFFGFLALLKLSRQEKIDVISSHWIVPNGFIAALVSRIIKVPFITTIPGSDIYMGGKNEFFKSMVGYAAKSASYVLSDSSYYLKQLNDLGFRPDKTKVIRYGVDIGKFRPTAKDKKLLKVLRLRTRDLIILAVGRMVAKKGFVYLIEAMPQVLEKNPDAKLVMVGDGEERTELEEKAKRLKVYDSIVWAGTISYDELSNYYNLADVFVMPSIKDEKGNLDASPVSMMEAMACGTPVVATKFSGSNDLVIEGETGYFVKEKNSKQISDSIVKLLSRKEKKEIKRRVRKIACKNFSVDVIAKKYTKIFREVLG